MMSARFCRLLLFLIYAPALLLCRRPAPAAESTAARLFFRDRAFHPADPFSSDDYLLTTVFLSGLAGQHTNF